MLRSFIVFCLGTTGWEVCLHGEVYETLAVGWSADSESIVDALAKDFRMTKFYVKNFSTGSNPKTSVGAGLDVVSKYAIQGIFHGHFGCISSWVYETV